MQQSANVEFDFQGEKLTITGELLPASPTIHDQLAALVGGKISAVVKFKNERNIITYSLVVEPK